MHPVADHELFTAQGVEATSLRQIAERLGISKASLSYHFASKDEIVRSLFSARGDEAAELLDWARFQEPAPDLLERAVLRWVDSTSLDKLRGIRFVNANPAIVRGMDAGSAEGTSLSDVEIVAAAREVALAFVRMLRGSSV